MALLTGLRWYEARHYAKTAAAPVRRASWPSIAPLVIGGVATVRWLRKLPGSGSKALWYRDMVSNTTSRAVCTNTDMTREDFLATDWTADIPAGTTPTTPEEPPPPPPPPPPGNCATCSPSNWRAGGDAHFVIDASFVVANDGTIQQAGRLTWDDNSPDEGEVLYAGSATAQGKVEVWYWQKPFPPVSGGMVTAGLRFTAPEGGAAYVIKDGVWKKQTLDADNVVVAETTIPQQGIYAHDIAIPAPTPGANGGYRLTVTCMESGGVKYFDWSCTPATPCLIPQIYGGLGAVVAILQQPWAAAYLNGIRMRLSGPGADGWKELLAPFGMTRDSLESPYSGRAWQLSEASWQLACGTLNALPLAPVEWPWDPTSAVPDAHIVVSCATGYCHNGIGRVRVVSPSGAALADECYTGSSIAVIGLGQSIVGTTVTVSYDAENYCEYHCCDNALFDVHIAIGGAYMLVGRADLNNGGDCGSRSASFAVTEDMLEGGTP